MNDHQRYARRVLLHYFSLLARASGITFDADCRVEIEGIVDAIIDAVKAELREEIGVYQETTR